MAGQFRSKRILTQGDYHCSLQEVADEIGVSRERIRQIEHGALAKLRVAFEAKGLTRTELDEDTPEHYLEEIPIHFHK